MGQCYRNDQFTGPRCIHACHDDEVYLYVMPCKSRTVDEVKKLLRENWIPYETITLTHTQQNKHIVMVWKEYRQYITEGSSTKD